MRSTNKLTALKISRTTKPGRYGDGLGLWLQVSKTGTKSWLFRYMRDGRAREMGLGPIHAVSLSDARMLAQEARAALAMKKVDPIDARSERRREEQLEIARRKTFRECTEAYFAAHRAGWKNAKHAQQWLSTLETYAFPVLGPLPVSVIDTDAVLRVLQPIWATKNETASRLRGRIENVLDYAKSKKLREGDNPALWRNHLKNLLPAKGKVAKVQHHKAMHYRDLPAFMARLRKQEFISARALEFTILTAARTGETIGADWSEFDLEGGLWIIPASRMKADKEHRVPLCTRGLEILDSLPRESRFVFPGARANKPLSNMAMLELLRGLDGNGATVHGFRSTFMDYGHDVIGCKKEMMDMALAHKVNDKTEAAYRRMDMLDRRRNLMAAWADYCNGPHVTNIMPFKAISAG